MSDVHARVVRSRKLEPGAESGEHRGGFDAAIFDMDGVVTRTARLHAAAWKELFDDLLRQVAPTGAAAAPFGDDDYREYVDGRPRLDGVRSFLRARGVSLPEGAEGDPPEALTVHGLARRKDRLFDRRVRALGVDTFPSTITLIEELRRRDVKTGLVTSSRHGRQILAMTGLDHLFDAKLDGNDLAARRLAGKPRPDMFLDCARSLGATADRAIVFEDALAGVQAGRSGGFALVVGVARAEADVERLAGGGADQVVRDLDELDVARLESAVRARRERIAWYVEADGFERSRESAIESLFTVGNGYMGIRGALDSPTPGSESDLFVAGVYDREHEALAHSEIVMLASTRDDPYAQLVPLPFPFRVGVRVAGEELDACGPHRHALKRRLDLRRGVLHVDATFETPDERRTTVRSRRFASLDDPHLLVQEIVVAPENHWSAVEIEAALIDPDTARGRTSPTCVEHVRSADLELVRYATSASELEVCIASRSAVERGAAGSLRIRRAIAVYTSRDGPEPRAAALAHVQRCGPGDFDALLEHHAVAWSEFWAGADIRVAGSPAVTQALRFTAYHLRIAAGTDPRVSVPARALTGRAYEGHVFWDTEIFMLPFYLHVAPVQARSLILYRCNTLDGARRRARELGYRGACFAWESTVTGDDVTPSEVVIKSSGASVPIFTGPQQVHVTADVAYALWRYWEATHDDELLSGPGAELLFETARFWVSRVTPSDGRYHIRGVVGPDEYHHDVDDNAYTNWMARFNLERAAWVARSFGSRARARFEPREAEMWTAVADGLMCPAPDSRGVIEQFEGFFGLGEYPLPDEERFQAPVSRLFDWEKINRSKLLKQADVLMLPLLFPDAFSDEVVAANYHYYEPLTAHGSSLSPSVHAAIAARLGLEDDFARYWQQSLWLDLSDEMDNSALGVHSATMGGTWQALVFGLCGVRFTDAGPAPSARAKLPAGWRAIAMTLAYRGARHDIVVPGEGARP